MITSTALLGCNMTTGLTTCCATLYAPGPGVMKLGAGKRFVFKGNKVVENIIMLQYLAN